MTKCDGCKYYSELIAKIEYGNTVAMCLNDKSPKYQQYTLWSCDKKEEGYPIDLYHTESEA